MTKLPPGLEEAAESRIEALGLTRYQYLQNLVVKDLCMIPKIPKKPPPAPKRKAPPPIPVKKTRPARMITELARRMNRLLSEGISKDDEVFAALTREILEASADLPCWDETRRDELRQIQWRLTERVQVLDTFERGVLDAADEEWRASLPALRRGSSTPED